ncbi:SPFH domain-containing protein [Caryophanon tenue]|uniref:Virion core protein (Lumpy skin disease virus) n=1 Tax=Caryophanon tenue TaxID=33978 RepID=A0A1C0Y751_9BACL|nr:SPFH domain-containing protein [Caryophanon tenue]OCS82980.1 virion core protein (lumpy skin disease virus) [Caryophanon tenue]
MGLLQVGKDAAAGVLEDQWRDYFYVDALPADILMVKANRRTGKRSNNKGNDNIISDGSIIAINEGQCMIIVEQGRIVDFSAEPGEYVYDFSTEPSIFTGSLKNSIIESFKQFGKRFVFGGEPPKDQRLYFVNIKEIPGNKYGTPAPVPFRVVDRNIGLDIDIAIRCHGEYSYTIVDPILFYKNVAGNVPDTFNRAQIDSQLKSELMTALQPAFAQISAQGVRYSEVPAHTTQLAQALNEVLSASWTKKRGIAVFTFGISTLKASEEDEAMIKQLQKNAVFRNADMAAANLAGAQADAMINASKNENGALGGFMGMNMAQNAGGINANDLYATSQQQKAQQPAPPPPVSATGAVWTCTCGAANSGKFCSECGAKQPSAEADHWTCSCGTQNKGKFCSNCGTQKPAALPTYACNNCGCMPADPTNPPKFCPECGDVFDDADKQ